MKLDNKGDNEVVINHELSSLSITQNTEIRISQSNTSKSSKQSLATSIIQSVIQGPYQTHFGMKPTSIQTNRKKPKDQSLKTPI